MNSRLKIAIDGVVKAGEYLNKQFRKRHTVAWKQDNTVLLGDDIESEKIVVDTIFSAFPTDSFLTEERDSQRKEKGYF